MSFDQARPAIAQSGQASRRYISGLPRSCCAAVLWVLTLTAGCQAQSGDQPPSAIVELTDANFHREVMESTRPVLVEIWAPWCRPCLEMQPAIEQLAHDFRGQVKVAALNIDENSETAASLGVDAPPVIIIFQNGAVIKRRSGRQTKDSLTELLSGLTTGGDVRHVARRPSRERESLTRPR